MADARQRPRRRRSLTLIIGVAIGILTARNDRLRARPPADPRRRPDAAGLRLPDPGARPVRSRPASRRSSPRSSTPCRRSSGSSRSGSAPSRRRSIEAATASGATERQLLWKVQLPMSREALLLAANQGIVMVLAMVVIGGLVGAGALGYDVITGLRAGRGLRQGPRGGCRDRAARDHARSDHAGRAAAAPDHRSEGRLSRPEEERTVMHQIRWARWFAGVAVIGLIVVAGCAKSSGDPGAADRGEPARGRRQRRRQRRTAPSGERGRRAPRPARAPATRAPSR